MSLPPIAAFYVSSKTALRLIGILIAAAFVVLVWKANDVLFLLFAAILLAISLQTAATNLSKKMAISYRLALTCILLFCLLSFCTLAILFAPLLIEQLKLLSSQIPQGIEHLENQLANFLHLDKQQLLQNLLVPNIFVPNNASIIFSTTLGALTSFVVFIFIGIYLALDYSSYVAGCVYLAPNDQKEPTKKLLEACSEELQGWLRGQLASVIFVWLLTTCGLWLWNIPLAFILGLLAGILTFIPAIGSILAAIPAILIAWTQGHSQAFYVFLLFVGVHILEGYIVSPYIQKRNIALPPALVLTAQISLWVLAGFWGLVLAAPFTALLLVIVDKVYVREVLGNPVEYRL